MANSQSESDTIFKKLSLNWKGEIVWKETGFANQNFQRQFKRVNYGTARVIVMLVISLCWWLYDDDRFEILVAESICWQLFSLCWWFFNALNRSSTYPSCQQHIPSSVTSILWPNQTQFYCSSALISLKSKSLIVKLIEDE